MRLLIQTPEVQADVDRVVEFASKHEHWYHPSSEAHAGGDDPSRPGNDPEHRYELWLGSYYCIFSYTETEQGVFKHLSVRTPQGHGVRAVVARAPQGARYLLR